MSCLSSGLLVNCASSCAGGVSRFWVAAVEDIASLTITSGEITAITMEALATFFEFVPYEETANFTENIERANCNSVVTQQIQGIFPCRSQAVREAINELKNCCCGLVVIHEENNGQRWLWGAPKDLTALGIHYAAQLTASESVSGTAINDQNQTTLTIQSRGTEQAFPVDAAVVIPVP